MPFIKNQGRIAGLRYAVKLRGYGFDVCSVFW